MQFPRSFLLPASLLALVSAVSASIIPRATGTDLVQAIFYSPNGTIGACGDPIQNTDFSVALNSADFADGATCGKETFVTFEGASITAIVEDVCTECAPGGIKLPSGIEQLTGTTGPIEVTWHLKVFPPIVEITGLAAPYTPGQGQLACLQPTPSNGFGVALSDADLEGGAICGKIVDITLNDTTIKATVDDLCSGCAAGEIRVTPTAFAALTGSSSAQQAVEVVWGIETVGV